MTGLTADPACRYARNLASVATSKSIEQFVAHCFDLESQNSSVIFKPNKNGRQINIKKN